MSSLTSRYKKAERAGFRKVTARLTSIASSVGATLVRLFRGVRQGITILVVEDSAKPPKGITVSYFSLALGGLGCLALLAFTLVFAFGLARGDSRLSGSNAELDAAKQELDRYKEGTERLIRSYAELSAPLASIASAVDKPSNRQRLAERLAPMAPASLLSRNRDEAVRIAEIGARLENAIPSIEETGKAVESMNAVKAKVPALWPIKNSIGHLSATYGPNPNPFTGEPYFHTGIDCSNYREGDPIVATADGSVVFAGVQGGYGRSVVISHPNGYFTRYGHMQRLLVRDGQKVKQGQVIGILGNTGHTTGPHAHYEVIIGNKFVDPIDYLWSGEDRKAPEGTIPFGME
jgi:murein DD-endopeptidase MepM/ murein hydrolase activator NlpD